MGIHAVVGRISRYANHALRMKLLRLPLVLVAALIVIAVRLLGKAGIVVKFGAFHSSRIGHLVGNTNVYLSERAAGRHSGTHIWTQYGPVCNKQVAKMISRVLPVDPTRLTVLATLINKMFKGWEAHDIFAQTWDRDPHNLNEKTPVHFSFTAKEEARGRQETASLGIPLGDKWVCLIVRDGAYLPTLTYHRYRDCDVDDFADVALILARRGYYVVRMGAKVEKAFGAKHPRIIDYATSDKRNDFTSVYLAAKCAFAISTSTGLDAVCEAFKRPMCLVNVAPIEHMRTYIPNSVCIWQHHEKDGKRLSIKEICDLKAGQFMRAEEFENAGITLIRNTPQEITDAVMELEAMLTSWYKASDQTAFWRDFPRSLDAYTNQPLHGEIRMRIGDKFLRGYHAEWQDSARRNTGT